MSNAAEFRTNVFPTGHRGRGSGIGLSLADLEAASIKERHPAKHVWYVNSNASKGLSGTSWGGEFQTIHEASAAATSGDVILVAPMHVETVSAPAGLVLGTGRVLIYGYGNGNRRPQINFTTVVGADMDVTAAAITMVNFRFTGGIDALTGPIDVDSSDFALIDCVTEDVTGQATDFIVTDANAFGLLLVRPEHRGASGAGAQTWISIVGGDVITIEDPWVDGNFGTAAIENVTTAATNLNIYGGARRPGYLRTRNAADVLITCVATTTGNIGPHLYGRLQDNAANITEAYLGADMQYMQPLPLVNLDSERGLEFNQTASAG